MSQFEGKVALVTGATSGIGKDAAIIFAQQKAQVVVTGRRQEEGEQTVEAIAAGGKGLFVQMDVSDVDFVKDGFAKIAQTFAQVDCKVPQPEIGVIFLATLLTVAYEVRGDKICAAREYLGDVSSLMS